MRRAYITALLTGCKACATALAEAGASTHEISAVTGHTSLEEIERYTRAAQKKMMADAAIAKLKR
jgi:hypothetical protein